ncbi:Hypothetical predicted protein [Pelobates cultripes]|uniref:Uncharacterized protein n=1 Tax=Pelobates cultripes TaxID=61616 RepID=A0AAD1WNC2_PELCU|nr:Hypothetical predicted protein [Pelobates cultripes]CAH2315038.1 Hypothetical predicted protein [Pelobates cultripes]
MSTHTQEGNFKWLSRWHLTPSKINTIFPNASAQCWRCPHPRGTPSHIWWSCPVMCTYWSKIIKMIHTITNIQLPQSPETALFLHLPPSVPKNMRSLTTHLLTAANALIPSHWKKPEAPTIRAWINKVDTIRLLEEIHYSRSHSYSTYERTWGPRLHFLKAD